MKLTGPPPDHFLNDGRPATISRYSSIGSVGSSHGCDTNAVSKSEADNAAELIQVKFEQSRLVDVLVPQHLDKYPRFEPKEVETGSVIGKGGFGEVSEVVRVVLRSRRASIADGRHKDARAQLEADLMMRKAAIADDCDNIEDGKSSGYVIKRVNKETLRQPNDRLNGIVDLVTELHFLSVFDHTNILKIRGLSAGSLYGRDTFILMDRLYETLDERIVKWKKRDKANKRFLVRAKTTCKKQKELLIERLNVAFDLADALRYLHKLGVVYRDLKPANIGFDIEGDVKVFDFGCSREIPRDGPTNARYRLTAKAGSLRYMAPEVYRGEPYNALIDVYSYGLILWGMLSLGTPFDGYGYACFLSKVFTNEHRPPISSSWPSSLQNIITKCWSSNVFERPSAAEVKDAVGREMLQLRSGEKNSQSTESALESAIGSIRRTASWKVSEKAAQVVTEQVGGSYERRGSCFM